MSHKLKLPSRYEPLKLSFSGGQGDVHICTDKHLSRKVAIKIIKDSTDTESIKNEITSLCEIRSKHVVQLFDFIKNSDGSIGIVQEFIPGDDLSTFNSKTVTVDKYLRTLYQIASGLSDIHAAGKIHRDIKPINMKFDDEAVVKIFDFGLSCHQSPSPFTATARGTDGFRAPELYNAPTTFTQAVDTYAFGVTAWSMLSNSMPSTLLDMPPLRRGPAPSFSTHSLKLPAEVVAALDSTLSMDPVSRPTMLAVKEVITARILFGLHRGLLSYGSKIVRIVGINRSITVNLPGIGGIDILYDGLKFSLRNISCIVYINNVAAADNDTLPGSCVLTLTNASKASRDFLTFDISHPEVVL